MEYSNSHLYFTIGSTMLQLDGGVAVLKTALAGAGGGVVTSNPSGINCGATCFSFYTPATQVTLTATPNQGSSFTGWSGATNGTCASAPTVSLCNVAMTSNQSITAAFSNVQSVHKFQAARVPELIPLSANSSLRGQATPSHLALTALCKRL